MNLKIILILLLMGLIFRLFISSNNNFLFNMDNARDLVDVREMVELHKVRLIGPTTAIEGFYNGPVWYYMLSLPYFITGGDPYGPIIMEIMMWCFGGLFLFLLVSKYYGKLALIAVGLIWIGSNYILLATQYSFNPNPVIFLTPLLLYYLISYLETNRLKYGLLTWFLVGLSFQFEIAASIFLPFVILVNLFLVRGKAFIKDKKFYLGILAFLVTLIPQIIFDLHNHFQLSKSLLNYKSATHGSVTLEPWDRFQSIIHSYYSSLLPTLMNYELFTKLILILFIVIITFTFATKKKLDLLTQITFSMVIIFFLINIPLKIDLMRWHLNAILVASIILIGFVIGFFSKINFLGKIVSIILVLLLGNFTIGNMSDYIKAAQRGDSGNSVLKNEVVAVDYTYKEAGGKNFKVYAYLPSVIDFPYQYLYWWRGLKKYGYLPEDYAYLPNKPDYIKQKSKLDTGNHPPTSGLTFLIKEPEDGRRHLWENSFKSLELLKTATFGAITVETRKAITQ